MTEEKPSEKAEEQPKEELNPEKGKGEELKRKEEELEKREADLKKREADLNGLGATIKAEYERKIEQQKADYEKRLEDRNEIIKQLSSESEKEQRPTFLEKLNKERELQNKKW